MLSGIECGAETAATSAASRSLIFSPGAGQTVTSNSPNQRSASPSKEVDPGRRVAPRRDRQWTISRLRRRPVTGNCAGTDRTRRRCLRSSASLRFRIEQTNTEHNNCDCGEFQNEDRGTMENHLSFPLLTIGKRARIARGVNQREKILEQHFHTVSLSGTAVPPNTLWHSRP